MAKTIIVYEAINWIHDEKQTVTLCSSCAEKRILIEDESYIETSSTDSEFTKCYDCKEYIEGTIHI